MALASALRARWKLSQICSNVSQGMRVMDCEAFRVAGPCRSWGVLTGGRIPNGWVER